MFKLYYSPGIIQTIQADGMKVKVLRGEPPGYSQAELFFSSQTNLPASVSWYTAFVNLSYELKMKSVKIILGGSWGQSPPEAKSYSFLTVLPTTYVLFRYFAFASMCYSLLPIMLNIFVVICQIADDFYEKKKKKKNPHFSRILPLQVRQRLFIITLNNLQEAVFRQQSFFFQQSR